MGESAENVREFYRRQGEQRERARIIELLEKTAFIWVGEMQLMQISRDNLLTLIKEEK